MVPGVAPAGGSPKKRKREGRILCLKAVSKKGGEHTQKEP